MLMVKWPSLFEIVVANKEYMTVSNNHCGYILRKCMKPIILP